MILNNFGLSLKERLDNEEELIGTISKDTKEFHVVWDCCTADNPTRWSSVNTVIGADVFISFDNGNTWQFEIGFDGTTGGPKKYRNGTERKTLTLKRPWTYGKPAAVKIVYRVKGPSFVTSGVLKTFDSVSPEFQI